MVSRGGGAGIRPSYPLYVSSHHVNHKSLQLIIQIVGGCYNICIDTFCCQINCSSPKCSTDRTRGHFGRRPFQHCFIHPASIQFLIADDFIFYIFSSIDERKHLLQRVSPEYCLLNTPIPVRHLTQSFCDMVAWSS